MSHEIDVFAGPGGYWTLCQPCAWLGGPHDTYREAKERGDLHAASAVGTYPLADAYEKRQNAVEDRFRATLGLPKRVPLDKTQG